MTLELRVNGIDRSSEVDTRVTLLDAPNGDLHPVQATTKKQSGVSGLAFSVRQTRTKA
jgi:hypothetical protein